MKSLREPQVALIDRDAILATLRETADRAALLADGFALAHLNARPGAGDWSMAEIMAHLALEETLAVLTRLKRLAVERESGREATDGVLVHPKPVSFAAELARFRAARINTLRLLQNLSAEQWERSRGTQHLEFDSVESYARSVAEHDIELLAQMETTAAICGAC